MCYLGRLADRLRHHGADPARHRRRIGIGYRGRGPVTEPVALSRSLRVIGFGSGTSFAPLISDISHWFVKRRGIAVAIAASGNYFAGAVWPPVIQHFISIGGLAHNPYRHRHLL